MTSSNVPRTPLRVVLFFAAAVAVLATSLCLAPASWASPSDGPPSPGGTCDGGAR